MRAFINMKKIAIIAMMLLTIGIMSMVPAKDDNFCLKIMPDGSLCMANSVPGSSYCSNHPAPPQTSKGQCAAYLSEVGPTIQCVQPAAPGCNFCTYHCQPGN